MRVHEEQGNGQRRPRGRLGQGLVSIEYDGSAALHAATADRAADDAPDELANAVGGAGHVDRHCSERNRQMLRWNSIKPGCLRITFPACSLHNRARSCARKASFRDGRHRSASPRSFSPPLVGEPGRGSRRRVAQTWVWPVSYTHLRAHETVIDLVCRLLLEKKKQHHT